MSSRRWIACALVVFSLSSQQSIAHEILYELKIVDRTLSAALLALSRQTGIQLVIPDRASAGYQVKPISGSFTVAGALTQLLAATDLRFEFIDSVTVVIRAPEPLTSLRITRQTPGLGSSDAAFAGRETSTGGSADHAIESIVVTGTRVARTDASPMSPVTVLGREVFRYSDNRNVETAINAMPQAIPDGTATTNNTGPNNGSATIDLRGLGAARTLVLLDGRRMVGSTIDTTVDVNGIPPGMIERVEVVTGGASAVYGSDALAGVVNFILRDGYVGAELEAGYGITGHGDGEKYTLNGTYGVSFNEDRTNINMFFDLARRQPVREQDRSLFRSDLHPIDGEFVVGGSTSLPGGLIPNIGTGVTLDQTQLSNTDLAHFLANFASDANGGIVLTPHISFDTNGNPLPFRDPQDRFSTAPFVFLQIPQERAVASFRIRHELPSSLTLFTDLLYSHNQVDRALSPVAFTDLKVPENSPFITPALRAILAAREIPDPDNLFTMRLRVPASGSRTRSNRREVIRVVSGVGGPIFDHWNWQAYVNYGRMELLEVEGAAGLRSHIQSALGCPVAGNDADNDFVPESCPSTPVYPDGVRINPFGAGNISSQDLAFLLAGDIENRTDVNQLQTGANLLGESMTLPGGPIGWAWGTEYRKENSAYVPDLLIRDADVIGSSIESPTSGSFDVFEVFGELYAPIFSYPASGNSLAVNAAVRWANYSSIGQATNWKLGMEWTATPHIRLRGQYQSAIRAPNSEELYRQRRQTFQRFIDPCAGATDTLRAACVAVGVNGEDIDHLSTRQRQIPVMQSGNPDLQQERSQTVTVGMVVEPLLRSNLRVSLDYFNISVNDAVSILSVSETANLCLAGADPDNANCRRIRRGLGSVVVGSEQFFENVAFIEREGVDFGIGYEALLGGGVLDTQLLGTWLLSAASQANPFSPIADCAGFVSGSVCGRAFPELKTQLRMHYEVGKLGFNFRWLHLGAVRDAKVLIPSTNPLARSRIKARNYFDLGVKMEVNDNISLLAGVINVTADEPPLLESQVDARTDPATYDVIGRRYYISARLRF